MRRKVKQSRFERDCIRVMRHFDTTPGGIGYSEESLMSVARTMAEARLAHPELIVTMLNLMALHAGPDAALAELRALAPQVPLLPALSSAFNVALVAHEPKLEVPTDDVRAGAIARMIVDDELRPVDVIAICASGMLAVFPAADVRRHIAALASPEHLHTRPAGQARRSHGGAWRSVQLGERADALMAVFGAAAAALAGMASAPPALAPRKGSVFHGTGPDRDLPVPDFELFPAVTAASAWANSLGVWKPDETPWDLRDAYGFHLRTGDRVPVPRRRR